MNEDKTLALLATLYSYDKQLIKEALVQHRYKVLDDIKATLDASTPFDDRILAARVGLDRIARLTELMEALS